MKKFILFLSLILSGIYLANFIGAITVTKNSGEVLDNITWTNISGLTNKIDVSGSDIKLNGKLYVTGDICDGDGNCLGKKLIDKDLCELAGWIWVDKNHDVKIGNKTKTGFCISPRFGDFGDTNDGTDGISWNGWGGLNNVGYYEGWDATNVTDGGNPTLQYGQTKDLQHVIDENTLYTCKTLGTANDDYDTADGQGDTIYNRMKWLATIKNNYTEAQSIDWIVNSSTGIPLVGGVGASGNKHAIPALYIADCIDGKRDLGTDMTYIHNDNSTDEVTYAEYNTDKTTLDQSGTYPGCNVTSTDTADLDCIIYQNRQKYLTAWTQKSGSHLPSAFSYINADNAGPCSGGGDCDNISDDNAKGEYQKACELYQNDNSATNNDFYYAATDQSSDQHDGERIWLSAIGRTSGLDWGRGARVVRHNDCLDQYYDYTGSRASYESARFVVRP